MSDHELYITGGSPAKQNLNLVRQEGRALYSVTELTPQYQEELRFTQQDWMGGQGRHTFDPREPDVYFEGQSIETTQDGRFFLGPLICEVKEDDDTYLDSAVLGFRWSEAKGEWLCWTSGKIYRYIQDDTGIDTAEVLDASETGVDCDADATTPIPVGSVIYVESEQMLVTAVSAASPYTLTVVRGYHGTTAATHVTNTDIYIYKWTAATTAVSGVTDLCEYNDIMYAARGASTVYSYSADNDTWTATDLGNTYANGFFVAPNPDGTANVLYLFKTPNEIRNTTDGRTVAGGGQAWSSVAYIGDTSDNITKIFLVGDKLFVGREDQLYYYTATGRVDPQMEELSVTRDPNNFKYLTIWKTSAYFSLISGLGELTASESFYTVGPLTRIDDIGKTGICVGLASDADFTFAAFDEGTNTIIYKGREITSEYGLRWEWCPFVYLGTNTCASIEVCQHSVKDRRLWFAYGTGTNYSTAYVNLFDDPTSSNARYASSGWVRMSYLYGTDPYWDKMFQSIITETENCAVGRTVTPKYRKNTDTTATELTSAITTDGIQKTDLTSELTCKRIQFELHLATNDSTKTPEVKYFQARGVEKPEVVRIHDCTYSLGTKPSVKASTIRANFRLARTSTTLLKFSDLRYTPAGTSGTENTDYVWATIMPGFPKEIEIYHERSKQPELALQVQFREISF